MTELIEKVNDAVPNKESAHSSESSHPAMKLMSKFIVAIAVDPLITFNAGGEIFTTRQSTLRKIPNTVLALATVAPWSETFTRDENGRYFLDCDPKSFEYLLNQLRYWSSSQKVFRLPKDIERRDSFRNLCHQLHFHPDLIEGLHRHEKFNKICGHILLEDKGLIACHVGTYRHAECRGMNTYSSGIHRIILALKHHNMEKYNTFIGIIWSGTAMQENSFESSTAYGWAGHGQVYLRGVPSTTIGYGGYDFDICNNDVVELILNCQLSSISLFNHRTKKIYEIPIDTQQGCPFPWQLHINLYAAEDCVKILNPN